MLAEEKKAMVLKGSATASAAKEAPAPVPVQVAQEAPAKTVQVVRQEGNVLKGKGKEGQ
nr:hypothetical protein WG33_0182 [uncultured bacterium]